VLIFREYHNALTVTTEIVTNGDFIHQVYEKKRVVVGSSEKGGMGHKSYVKHRSSTLHPFYVSTNEFAMKFRCAA